MVIVFKLKVNEAKFHSIYIYFIHEPPGILEAINYV